MDELDINVELAKLSAMQFTVLQSAYVILARHLQSACGLELEALANDLEYMAGTQDHPTWRNGHEQLVAQLRSLCSPPSSALK